MGINNNIKMQADNHRVPTTALFSGITEGSQFQLLLEAPVQAECCFYKENAPLSQMQDEADFEPILLQVTNQHVIQRTSDRSQVISFFVCHYDVQFEIIRKPLNVCLKLGRCPTDQAKHVESSSLLTTSTARWFNSPSDPRKASTGDIRQNSRSEVHRAVGLPQFFQGH